MTGLRLLVMRHAKSSWSSGATDDHDRPLSKRGRRDAARVADRMVELGWVPELVVSSDAARTTQTWARMEGAFDGLEVRFEPSLYHAGLRAVRGLLDDATARSILVVGHNPGWDVMVEDLTGRMVGLTTGNVACLEHPESSWEVALRLEGSWRLTGLIRPRELR